MGGRTGPSLRRMRAGGGRRQRLEQGHDTAIALGSGGGVVFVPLGQASRRHGVPLGRHDALAVETCSRHLLDRRSIA
jgi:hypothetical protein